MDIFTEETKVKSRKQRKGSGKYKNVFQWLPLPRLAISQVCDLTTLNGDFSLILLGLQHFFAGGFRCSSCNWLVCSQISSGSRFQTTANKAMLNGSMELKIINLMFNGFWTKVSVKLLLWIAIFNLIFFPSVNICEYLWRNPTHTGDLAFLHWCKRKQRLIFRVMGSFLCWGDLWLRRSSNVH